LRACKKRFWVDRLLSGFGYSCFEVLTLIRAME
jgi:hypothetical protein